MFPNVFQLVNRSWTVFGQILTIVEKPQVLRGPKSKIPICKKVFDGLFTEKHLEECRLAQMYRHSRKTITGREVFLGPNGKYTNEELIDFNTYTSDLNWHEVPWIKPIEKKTF